MRNPLFFLILFTSCNVERKQFGTIERLDPAVDQLISANAKVEIVAEGFDWSEGPLWLEEEQMLLFSDIPKNTIYKWTEEKGKEVYLTPSGYTSDVKRGGETGSNALILNPQGKLVLCQHGDRRMAMMDADIKDPKPIFKTIAGTYKGKKFNSPNDAIYNSKGELFFTDPPYGLEKNMDDPLKELSFQGVFKVKTNGEVVLLVDSLSRPNGLVLTPDEKTLIVGNSDGAKRAWFAFDLSENDSVSNARIFYDATNDKDEGAPDGMKMDKNGNLYSTGPGGIWIFDKNAKVIGKIKIPGRVSNVAFTKDQKTMFITADNYLLRVRL